jgi:hypothetical protein
MCPWVTIFLGGAIRIALLIVMLRSTALPLSSRAGGQRLAQIIMHKNSRIYMHLGSFG